eukprot:357329-Chlamydomonas_euryale.AAC.14
MGHRQPAGSPVTECSQTEASCHAHPRHPPRSWHGTTGSWHSTTGVADIHILDTFMPDMYERMRSSRSITPGTGPYRTAETKPTPA